MFDDIDKAYFERRARDARDRAAATVDPAIARIHLGFAAEYERKAFALTARRGPRLQAV